jgi:plastocyanin
MKRFFIVFAMLVISSNSLLAGTITGTVKAEGKPEAKEEIDSGKYESRKYKFLELINYDELKDFVVYIDQPVQGVDQVSKKPFEVLIQKDATFKPHVLPVLVGTTVEWPNKDDIYHNVFSMSEAKPFDLGVYKHNEVKRVTFDKPGRVDVFCSIHTKMSCIILVLENPFFAATDKNGTYKISNVPGGIYRLKAWHDRLPPQVKNVTVPQTGEVVMDFILTVSGLPKY